MWHCVEIEIEIKIKLDPIKRSVHIEHFQNTRMQDVLNEQILGSGITSCTNVVLQDLLYPLRFVLANHSQVMGKVLDIVNRTISTGLVYSKLLHKYTHT